MPRTHPHIDDPTAEQLRAAVEGKPPVVRGLYLAVHELVVQTIPGVACSLDLSDGQVGYGAHQYGYDGWGMAALAPYATWVSLAFLRATSLDDPLGLLEGTGVRVRHAKVRSADQLAEIGGGLRALVKAATLLDQA